MADVVSIAKARLNDPQRPLGSLFFWARQAWERRSVPRLWPAICSETNPVCCDST